MPKLVLPQKMLAKEEYTDMSASQKEEYIHNLLKEVLELNPKGITASQLDKVIYLGHSTIWHHLEILASRAQCFKMERGDTFVYHLNKVLDSLTELDIKSDYYTYCFNIIENDYGKFLRLQLKQENQSGTPRTRCGVLINDKIFDKVLDALKEIKKAHLNED